MQPRFRSQRQLPRSGFVQLTLRKLLEIHGRGVCAGYPPIRSRLDPIKKVARMVHEHLEGIVTAVVKRITNAHAEGINSTIQWLKYTARGYRNRERFRTAIYFHLGALDLYPDALTP